MDKSLIEAFGDTDYRVCLDPAEWASIRIGQPPPASLRTIIGRRPWGLITAWNPRSQPRADADNLAAQRELLSALSRSPEALIFPAIGVGTSGWSEPGLFAIGPDPATCDQLARHHRQLAYVHGHADGIAVLRLLE
jgi:hypothetical protein